MHSGSLRSALAVLVLVLAAPRLLAATTVQKVQLSALSAESARVVLSLSAVPRHKLLVLSNPDRIVIDLPAAGLASGLRLPQSAGPVRSMRSAMRPGKTLRLVIELTRKLEPDVNLAGSQLTIDIGAVPKQAAVVQLPAAPVPPAAVRAAHAPDDSGRDVIVAVDAGHGGTDPGAIGANGTREKDVVLAIARALAKRIDAEPGMRAFLTRNEDRKIELRDRINLAKKARADLFVSIHADSIERRDVAGSSVYVLSDRGASSEAARRLAARENAVDDITGREKSDPLDSILMGVVQNASIGSSAEAAERVLAQLDQVGTIRKTQVQTAGFVVLKLPATPSMLVETAYISNPNEERKLRDPGHQAAVAEAIFNGVREHLRSRPPDGSLFAQLRDARRGVAPVMAGSADP